METGAILAAVTAELQQATAPSLRRVINATGTVVHTNLGRSPLPEKVARQVAESAAHYSNLEYDILTGQRGDRSMHVEPLICELTGAEAALVVNNNAAALLLALSALARGKEVIVSRGELVEIGGSFRIPDVMLQSGAILREIGTTNRTHPKDYRSALSAETALLLKVSCSNFAITGFTAEVSAAELAALAKAAAIPLMVDAGSGAFVDLMQLPGCRETTVKGYLNAGADLVVCSGDKLLGGPQAGIIAGRRDLVEPLRRHPLLRALRLDKMTLAALAGVLMLYRDERSALREIPTLRMLTMEPAELAARAKKLLRQLRRSAAAQISLELVDGNSMVGGGALPDLLLPSKLIAVKSATLTAEQLECTLRNGTIPVIGRIAKGTLLLDTRCIMDDDIPLLVSAISAL
jgi:L-seryl-tRNA(Ser) seleniumtransferase